LTQSLSLAGCSVRDNLEYGESRKRCFQSLNSFFWEHGIPGERPTNSFPISKGRNKELNSFSSKYDQKTGVSIICTGWIEVSV
jgi:hypothetical protein